MPRHAAEATDKADGPSCTSSVADVEVHPGVALNLSGISRRRVPEAFSIPSLKYDEAMELAYFGAQVPI